MTKPRYDAKYMAVYCPTCMSGEGQHCVQINPSPQAKVNAQIHGRGALWVPYHRARKNSYAQIHGRKFNPLVVSTPNVAVTPQGNTVTSGTDRLNQLMGRTP